MYTYTYLHIFSSCLMRHNMAHDISYTMSISQCSCRRTVSIFFWANFVYSCVWGALLWNKNLDDDDGVIVINRESPVAVFMLSHSRTHIHTRVILIHSNSNNVFYSLHELWWCASVCSFFWSHSPPFLYSRVGSYYFVLWRRKKRVQHWKK